MNNNSNKLLWIVIALTVAMIGAGVCSRVLVNKVADRVIQRLQKEYSPSPYGPGIDPDKLDSEKITNALNVTQPVGNWNDNWEKQRN